MLDLDWGASDIAAATDCNWFRAVSDDKMINKKKRKPSKICFCFSSEFLLPLSHKRAVTAWWVGYNYLCFIDCHQFGGNLTGSSVKKNRRKIEKSKKKLKKKNDINETFFPLFMRPV